MYYNSKDDFFAAVESGDNEPTYIGLLEIVRVLKLISQNRKKTEVPTPIQPRRAENQLSFADEDYLRVASKAI